MAFWNVRIELTMNGASGEVEGIFDDDPMCMLMTVSVSSHAWKSGSQKPFLSCTDGRPSGTGFSENVMLWLPLAAQRRISAAASCGSHSGTIVRGISLSLPSPAHQTSIIQSL